MVIEPKAEIANLYDRERPFIHYIYIYTHFPPHPVLKL